MTRGYHRDSKRFVKENCEICPHLHDGVCRGIVLTTGYDLIETGEMPDADPHLFYFFEECPLRVGNVKESPETIELNPQGRE